jgi:hypothetical protein
MEKRLKELPKLKPVKFPKIGSSGASVYDIKGTRGQPTRVVIAEMKRLSRQDIYPAK